MAAKDGPFTLSFPLNLGLRDTAVPDDVVPVGERPELVESLNTRLSIIQGIPTKPPNVTQVHSEVGRNFSGIVPSKVGSTLIFDQNGTIRSVASSFAPLQSNYQPNVQQNSYYPYNVAVAGTVPGGGAYANPAIVQDDLGRNWFASFRANSAGGSSLFISVMSYTGEMLLTPTVLTTVAAAPTAQPWCGLSLAGGGYIVAWWNDAGVIKCRQISMWQPTQTLTLVGGGPTTVYTPTSTPAGSIALHYAGSRAFLACRNSSLATSVTIIAWDSSSMVAVGAPLTVALGANLNHVGVRAHWNGPNIYVAVCCSKASGSNANLLVDGNAISLTWNALGASAQGTVACSFYRESGTIQAVYAATHASGGVGAAGSGTIISFHDISTGSSVPGSPITLPWKGLIANGAVEISNVGSLRPLFLLQNLYSANASSDPLSINFVFDPGVEVYRCTDVTSCSVVGHFGVDTSVIYPVIPNSGPTVYNGVCFDTFGSRPIFTYLEDLTIKGELPSVGYSARWVSLDTTPKQPRVVHDSDGLAMIAAGPAYWDGAELAEWCPTTAPRIFVEANTGVNAIGAGTYLFAAVVFWKDGTGQLRRSSPSNLYTITVNGTDKPKVWVTLPASMRNGTNQEGVSVMVYCTMPNGTVPFAQPWLPAAGSSNAYHAVFTTLSPPTQGATNPPIYTTGGAPLPLPARCPPTFADHAIVVDRMWGVVAEKPNEVWFSKEKEADVAFEWASEATMALPASAGGAVAVVEMNGCATFLCRNGIWQITGTGPGPGLDGMPFNPPVQISEIGCTEMLSVVKTPVGVFYRSGNRFAVLGPGQSDYLDQLDASADQLGSTIGAHFRESREVVWFCNGVGGHVVYNYELGRWSRWESGLIPVWTGIVDPSTGKFLSASQGALYELDPTWVSQTVQMRFQTGWIPLGGPEDDNVIDAIIFRGRYLGAHDLTVGIDVDYNEYNPVAHTYTNADLVASTVGNYYSVLVGPRDMGARSIRLTIAEANSTGNGMAPVSVTIQYRKGTPGVRQQSFLPSGRR